MYYENKRSFYIKQYGPAALIILVSVVCIVAGIVLGFKDKTELVAKTGEVVETNSYIISDKAIKGEVINVNDLTITIKTNTNTYDINLIGITQNKKNKKLSDNMKNDLAGKTVTIDYDNSSIENGKNYAYIYVDGILYNEKLLKEGKAELRAERQNTSKLDVLLEAQLEARHNEIGIWAY